MPRRRRWPAQLGATNRTGPRTGTVPVDERQVARVARKLVSKFPPADGEHCRVGDVRPAHAQVRGVQVRTPTNDVRTVDVEVHALPREIYSGGKYLPKLHRIVVYADPRVCGQPYAMAKTLMETLRHELAHATDPGIRLERERAGYQRKHNGRCDYINDPLEITARLAETKAQLEQNSTWLRRQKRDGDPFKNGDVRLYSDTYAEIESCLTPKNKRRFLKVAAWIWDSIPVTPRRR